MNGITDVARMRKTFFFITEAEPVKDNGFHRYLKKQKLLQGDCAALDLIPQT